MSDFVQTMKDWRRMCCAFNSCAACPLGAADDWASVLCAEGGIKSARPEIVEKVVSKWAAEHPEPVYPNWSQWLVSIGVIPKEIENCQYRAIIELGLINPIPADIAQKLGIEPKEG